MTEIKFVIPGKPITKKNSQQIYRAKDGRSFVAPSSQFTKYQRSAALYCPVLRIQRPVNCQYVYYMPTRRPVDLSNLVSATDDILVHYQTLVDDNRDIVAGHDGSVVLYDKERPRVEIGITPMEDYEQWKKREE